MGPNPGRSGHFLAVHSLARAVDTKSLHGIAEITTHFMIKTNNKVMVCYPMSRRVGGYERQRHCSIPIVSTSGFT